LGGGGGSWWCGAWDWRRESGAPSSAGGGESART